MSLSSAYAAIKTRLQLLWPGTEPLVPLAFENVGYERDPAGSAFLVVELQWSGGEPASIGAPGNNLVRRFGNIWFHAFIPVGIDVDRALEIAQHAAGIFENQDISGVQCSAMEPGAGQSGSDDGLYFGQSVNVPFFYDESA